MKIKKKDSQAIISSLSGGVVPNRGLEYILVGRTEEAKQILKELDHVKQGASVIKFFIGPFGSGKSFIQALTQQIAFKEKFVVSHADFTPERRLYGGDGKAVAVYTELMKNLAISTSPEGNALPKILDKWISEVQSQVVLKKGYNGISLTNQSFIQDVEKEIIDITTKMDELVGGFDFAQILISYYKGFIEDNSHLQRCCLRWLKGEYTTKTEARSDLGVRNIIDDSNYYEYIKIITQFVRQIGYSGFVVNLDEAINLYKITHAQTREKNYETILKIYNDTLQGNGEGLYVTFGGTPEFLEDERRGLFSYSALKSRLQTNKFENSEFRDLSQPVIKLTPLKTDETFVLLKKVNDVFNVHHQFVSEVSDKDIEHFIKNEYARPGASEHLTTRDVVRNFIGALNILQQNPTFDRQSIFGSADKQDEIPASTARFSRFTSSSDKKE